jgi:hypothetical protein
VPEGERNLRQHIQEQTMRIARDFCGDSLGRLESTLQGDCAQLEELEDQLPGGEAKARIRDMVGSYSKIEKSLHRAARDLGAEDVAGTTPPRRRRRRPWGNPIGLRQDHGRPLELRPVGSQGPRGSRPAR